jgi:RNA polymerase sigma factor (sigma-70 family)
VTCHDPKDATAHLRLVRRVIKRYYSRSIHGRIELDDLVQEGLLGVMRAQRTWDPEKSKFSTYASMWIRQRIQRYIKNKHRLVRVPEHRYKREDVANERVVWLDVPCDGEGSPLHERIGKRDAQFECRSAHLDVGRLLALIPDERQRNIVGSYYVGGLTQEEIANALGLCRTRVQQIRKKGLKQIQLQLRRLKMLPRAA